MALSTIRRLQSRTGIKEYLSVIFRRRTVIILSFASVMLSTFYYAARIPDTYESFSTFVIEEQTSYVNQMVGTPTRSLSFYEGILNSRTFQEAVLDSIGEEAFAAQFPKFTRENMLEFINGNLTFRKTTYASFLHHTARAPTKELAYALASIGTTLFRVRCLEVTSEESRRAVAEIEKQLLLIRKNLEQAEHDYRSFCDTTGQIEEGMTPALKTLTEAYATSLAQIGIKEADLAAEKKQLSKLERKITPESNARSPEYLQLRAKLRELEMEKMRLEGLGIRLSGISTVDREIQGIERQLLKLKPTGNSPLDPATMHQWQELRKSVITKEGDLELFKRRMESYEKSIAVYKKSNPDILSRSLELLRLKRSKEVYENLYTLLLEKAEEERIKSASSSVGIKIVDLPVMPVKPVAKNQTQLYLAGLLLGLLLGFGLAFFIEFNDTTIKSNDDIERYIELPVLGTIPHIVHNKKSDVEIRRRSSKSHKAMTVTQYPRHVFNFDGDDSVSTEAYRSLRTNILFASPDKPLQVLALTSAGPSEGKSLTISNLALAYAQLGKRTLLIDTDLRRPVLHHIFNQQREPGFTDLFIANPDYDHIIRKEIKTNFSLISAGIFTPNPAELLGSHKMIQLLDYFRAHYDMIFFDTPPIVAVTDATLLGTKMDGLLIVVKSHSTDREIVLRAANILRNVGVKVVGTVLNDINLSHRYSSYGYYKYYYHYYKTKKD
ncbi:MAG: polysaccharide biosynthesis tyrosine autokinase [Chitinispirillaceae bacterium]|nr:polysaccharide biosynthesis tyrosine autokinase [Chitinispirillaceae bacterium]